MNIGTRFISVNPCVGEVIYRSRDGTPMSQDSTGMLVDGDGVARCWWCAGDPLYQQYHDVEWGRPVADDRRLFEKLCLEGFQAGLSWLTILRKRENFRAAFDDFDVDRVARFD